MIGVKPTRPKTHKEGIRRRSWCTNSFLFYFIFHFIFQSPSHLITTSSLPPSPSELIRPPSVCSSFLPQSIYDESLLNLRLFHSYNIASVTERHHVSNSTPLRFTNSQNSNTRRDQQCYHYHHCKFHYTTGVYRISIKICTTSTVTSVIA